MFLPPLAMAATTSSPISKTTISHPPSLSLLNAPRIACQLARLLPSLLTRYYNLIVPIRLPYRLFMTTPDNSQYVPITISLERVLIVAANLLYLKLLRAIISLCSCGGPNASISRAVQRTERRIVDAFFSAIPEARSHSEDATPQMDVVGTSPLGNAEGYPDSDNERRTPPLQHVSIGGGGAIVKHTSPNSPLMQVSSSISPAVRMSQGFSDRSAGRSMELVSSTSNSGALAFTTVPTSGSSYSGDLTRSASVGKGLSNTSSNIKTDAMMSASLCKLLDTPHLSSASRQTNERTSDPQVNKTPLDVEGLNRSRSVESYPGKFPASDGVEFSSLATASHQMRGRGTTSVRPFSEV